jgi:hypothetical protein
VAGGRVRGDSAIRVQLQPFLPRWEGTKSNRALEPLYPDNGSHRTESTTLRRKPQNEFGPFGPPLFQGNAATRQPRPLFQNGAVLGLSPESLGRDCLMCAMFAGGGGVGRSPQPFPSEDGAIPNVVGAFA